MSTEANTDTEESMRKAALYIQGRIVLGRSHLDAFEQLSEEEKSFSELLSGFYNEDTGEFTGYVEEEHFFQKEILLIRHGRAGHDDELDPDLSNEGLAQVESACRLLEQIDLDGFQGFCSPMLRCLRTAEIISNATGVRFRVEPQVMETSVFLEPGGTIYVNARRDAFPDHSWPGENGWVVSHESTKDFLCRIGDVLRLLPPKSIIISHSGFVTNLARMALCDDTVNQCGVPTASLTHIENREVKCLGRNL